MAKQNDIMQGRNEGMEFALRIVKDGGVEALEKEIERRNISGINARMTHHEVDQASNKIKQRTIDTILALTMMTLRDEFEFGQKRLLRFRDRFMIKTECLMDGYDNWGDLLEVLEDEVGIKLEISENS